MKIVYLTYGVHFPGGMERVLSIKANYLAEVLGHEVTIIITEGKGREPYFEFSKKIKIIDLDINYRETTGSIAIKILSRIKKRFLHKKRLKKVLMEIKPDISISMFMYEASILPTIKDGSIKIIESHFCRNVDTIRNADGSVYERFIGSLKNRMNSKIAQKYDCFVTLTKSDLEEYIDVKNKVCIPNPVTIQPILSRDLKKERLNVLAVGRISYQKGYDRLIDIWREIEITNPNAILKIYGSQSDTCYFNLIKKKIDEYNLKNIHIYPPVKNIEEVYNSSDLLVMTSHYEGLPLVIIEAMSCGLPIISFDIPYGPNETIKDGINGYLVKDGDKEDFINKLNKILNDPYLRSTMSKHSLEIAKKFSLESIMMQWIQLFEKLRQLQ